MRPSSPPRSLVVDVGSAADAARQAPGVRVLGVHELGPVAWETLPFDDVRGALGATPPGFAATPVGWVRPARWSLLDRFDRWQVWSEAGGERKPCRKAINTSAGVGCGGGVRWFTDVVREDDGWHGVVRTHPVPEGRRTGLVVETPTVGLTGEVRVERGAASLTFARGGVTSDLACAARCPVQLPSGIGALEISVQGPSAAFALELSAREADGASP